MLADVLNSAEAKSSVCRHKDSLHLGKYAHALPPIKEIRGQLSSATPEGRIPGCPDKTVASGRFTLITLRQQPRCTAPARVVFGVFLCLEELNKPGKVKAQQFYSQFSDLCN